ncbi:MAG: hypothetical protein ABIG44_16425 [Planctomycetota bacterium]
MRKLVVLGAALVMLASWATTVGATTVTVYTDKVEWENALGGQFLLEDFADDQLNPGVSFVSTESGHINPTLECFQDVLASESQNEPMTTWSFVPEIIGYGGNWTLGGPGGSGNSLLVYIDDLSLYVGYIPNSYNGGFWGFTSDTPFTSVRVIGGAGTNQQHYCLDDMVYSHPDEGEAAGDMNCDGAVNAYDIDGFICAVSPSCDYAGMYPNCDRMLADVNGDGVVNSYDIDGFIMLVGGG